MNNESKPDLLYAFVYETFDEGGWGPYENICLFIYFREESKRTSERKQY